jgi:hypothetical protein
MIVNDTKWIHPRSGSGYHTGFDPSIWTAEKGSMSYVLFLRGARKGYYQEWVLRADGKDIGTFETSTKAMLSV